MRGKRKTNLRGSVRRSTRQTTLVVSTDEKRTRATAMKAQKIATKKDTKKLEKTNKKPVVTEKNNEEQTSSDVIVRDEKSTENVEHWN